MKTVQIPKKLFLELIKYHLAEIDADEEYIKEQLQLKLNRLAAHQKYTERVRVKNED